MKDNTEKGEQLKNLSIEATIIDGDSETEYKSGDLAIRYLILNEKIIMNLLKGTKQFFIEWCELNLNEKYSEAHWNFDDYFTRLVKDEIEVFTNPLGLEWYDID